MITKLISGTLLLTALCSSASAGAKQMGTDPHSAREHMVELRAQYEQPENGPPVIFPPLSQETLEEVGSALLARWIAESRKEALMAGVSPIPSSVRAHLSGFFSDKLLSRVCYRVGDDNNLSLQTYAFRFGDADAITLGEVIIFRNKADVLSNYTLWSHELGHVQQYQRWGIDGFAKRYIEDFQAVEQEANDIASRFVIWSRERKLTP